MRIALASLLLAVAGGCSTPPETTASASDAPEPRSLRSVAYKDAPSYAYALQLWQTPEDVNAWIGAKFQYDVARAMALSESQRGRSGSLPIHSPTDFFADPSGVCVDLSRFAVETLQQIDPDVWHARAADVDNQPGHGVRCWLRPQRWLEPAHTAGGEVREQWDRQRDAEQGEADKTHGAPPRVGDATMTWCLTQSLAPHRPEEQCFIR